MEKRLATRHTETGAPDIDPEALGKLAKDAGVKLGSVAGKSGGTVGKVLGTVGAGLSGAGTGAGIGASIGSVIPGVGTVIGGAIGAIGGAIAGVVRALTGGGPRQLNARERKVLMRGLRIYKKRHLPGAFQTAVLYVYNPNAYWRLRAKGRLPRQIEARLLKKRAYAARAKKIERLYGDRIRRELAHLPPDFRTLVGVAAVTGHSRDLYFALRRALAQRAAIMNQANAPSASPPPEPAEPASPEPSATLEQVDEQEMPNDPSGVLPGDGDEQEDEAGDPHPSIFMRSVVDVVDSGDAVFAWRPVRVTYQPSSSAEPLLGTFWVFVDALKDRVTGLRWPCSAAETQMVADKILVSPRTLPHWWGPLHSEELPCLMMTTRLMCARWLHAKQTREIIPPHPDSTADLLIAGCTRMNRAIEADLARFGTHAPWVADPGKIWALHRRLFDGTSEGAINYGWHVDPFLMPVPGPVSTNAAIPGVSLIQSAGGRHPPDHIDYSQILMLVAPWCMIARPGQGSMVPMRTADVYRSRELAGLVTDDALPLPSVRQPFDAASVWAARRAFWNEQQRIYEGKHRRGLGPLDPRPRPEETGLPSVAGNRGRSPRRAIVVPRSHDPFASLARGRRLS
jgi:hypothetical protein